MKKNSALLPALRRLTLVALILVSAALQNTFFSGGRVGVFLLIPMAVSAAIFEKEFAGMLLGLLCGALWDLASPAPDGVFALTFAVCACACGLLSRYTLRNTLAAALLLNAAFTGIVCGVGFLFNCVVRGPGAAQTLLRFYLPSGVIAVLLLPLFYYPVKWIEGKLRRSSSGADPVL